MKKVKLSSLTQITDSLATDKLLISTTTGTNLINRNNVSNLEKRNHMIPAGSEVDTGIGPARSLRIYSSPHIGFFILGATESSVVKVSETALGEFGAGINGTGKILIYRKSLNSNVFLKNNTLTERMVNVQYHME